MKNLFMMIYLGAASTPRAFNLAHRVKSCREYGCASIEMSLVAEGRADGFFYEPQYRKRGIRVVDIAASYLILLEAGGFVYDMDGNPFDMPLDLSERAPFVAVSCPEVYTYIMGPEVVLDKPPVYALTLNPNSPDVESLARRVVAAMEGETLVLDTAAASVLGTEGKPLSEIEADIVITIGGDGTILRAAVASDAAIVGINNGVAFGG
jgi:NAD+ kinase